MPDKPYKQKVLVLMSGGVDSSTAAALLVRAGHEVNGVYLKLWEASKDSPSAEGLSLLGDPCWAQEMRDAARVAAHLGIPFQVWDVTAEYKKRVLQNFYAEYASGRTPNPDVLCNSEIKFGVALERALKMGYDYVATGHYARKGLVRFSTDEQGLASNSPCSTPLHPAQPRYTLLTAVDENKDQSYFLWRLTQQQLAHVMFPIGEYTKPQVRQMARKFGLHNWSKKDSQGVCFLGKIELKEFLYGGTPPLTPPQGGGEIERFTPPQGGGEADRFPLLGEEGLGVVRRSGPIVDIHGQLFGFHDGLAHFTIGQRHGTNVGDGHGPYFVVGKDMTTNTLVVAHEFDESDYRTVECIVSKAQFHDSYSMIHNSFTCMARTRYRASLCEVRIMNHESGVDNNSIIHDSCFIIQFKEPQRAVAPGQSIVFYGGDRVIGGGVIDSVTLKTPLEVCPPKFFHRTPLCGVRSPSSMKVNTTETRLIFKNTRPPLSCGKI